MSNRLHAVSDCSRDVSRGPNPYTVAVNFTVGDNQYRRTPIAGGACALLQKSAEFDDWTVLEVGTFRQINRAAFAVIVSAVAEKLNVKPNADLSHERSELARRRG